MAVYNKYRRPLVVRHSLVFGYDSSWQRTPNSQGGSDLRKKYVLKLTAEERAELQQVVRKGKAAALRLLGQRLVELKVADSICHETVRRALKKAT